MSGREMLIVSGLCARGHQVPSRAWRQQSNQRRTHLAGVRRIDSQTGLRWIHHFAAGIQRADQARTCLPHRLQIYKAETLIPAGERQTTSALDQALFLVVRYNAEE